ncbi:ribbon-helix-helix domain-containing protein [Natronospora cellulosivora (SeqCode)]
MSEKKDRLQFYINPEANRKLDIVSENLGVSKAALVREGVDRILKEKLPIKDDPAYKLIGLIDQKGEKENIAKNHDHYLYGEGRPDNE